MGPTVTRCKFVCISKNVREAKDQPTTYDVSFQAVTDGSPENKKFWQFTPSCHLSFNSINADKFQVNQEYYLDIQAAVVPVAEPEVIDGTKAE
jgi:hypothetical protein